MTPFGHPGPTGHDDVSGPSSQIKSEDISRARQAAEALFAPKQSTTAGLESVTADNSGTRKPRILSAHMPQAIPLEQTKSRVEQIKSRVEPKPVRSRYPIAGSDLRRIRTWLKYRMRIRQVAEIFEVKVSDIKRILQSAEAPDTSTD